MTDRRSRQVIPDQKMIVDGIHTMYECPDRLAEEIDPRVKEENYEIARDCARCGTHPASCMMMRKYYPCPRGYPDIRSGIYDKRC